jgi:hypothetical protein
MDAGDFLVVFVTLVVLVGGLLWYDWHRLNR